MRRTEDLLANLDWLTIMIYSLLVAIGLANIYAVVYDDTIKQSIFDISYASGRQFLFIVTSFILVFGILIVDARFYESFAYPLYALTMVGLILVLIFGREIGGNKAWLSFGAFAVQPSEFAKFATALALARMIGSVNFRMGRFKDQVLLFAIIGLPVELILLQKDTGTALVFTSFLLMFYREGMSPVLLILGISMVAIFVLTLLIHNQIYLYIGVAIVALFFILIGRAKFKVVIPTIIGVLIIIATIESVNYVTANVLKPHQQNRIRALLNPNENPLGYGWNVTQSKIAIGSGGFFGKGFLKGTQTKFDFVPKQSTDFIFCTIGEEEGWLGGLIVIGLFSILILRIIYISERQKSQFARVYGYGVATIFLFHFAVNIGMTLGLFPVIGIPLPFFSYGGSSLWGFTILLFILIKLDAYRGQIL